MLKIIVLELAMILLFSTVHAQNTEINTNNVGTNMFFPDKFLLDTINAFEQEKDSAYYYRRGNLAIFANNIYSEKLTKLDESILYDESNYETYRFTWYATWGVAHNPLSVRIENYDGNVFLIAKYFHRKLGIKEKIDSYFNYRLWGYGTKRKYDERVIIHDTIFIGQKEWGIFKNKLNSIDFWNVSPIEKTDIVAFDGFTWIFEGNNDGMYHMVHRSVFTKSSEIGDVCLYLLKLSGIPVKKRWFY
jgi:hypothetical protein